MKRPEIPVHLKGALNVAEAAAYTSCGESTIRDLVTTQRLARVPYTDRVLIARRELDRWVESTMAVTS